MAFLNSLPQECLPGVVHSIITGSHAGNGGKEPQKDRVTGNRLCMEPEAGGKLLKASHSLVQPMFKGRPWNVGFGESRLLSADLEITCHKF